MARKAVRRTISKIKYFKLRPLWPNFFGLWSRLFLNRKEKNWWKAPSGQTQPQKTRPKRKVKPRVIKDSQKAVYMALEAIEVVRPRRGSKWKKNFYVANSILARKAGKREEIEEKKEEDELAYNPTNLKKTIFFRFFFFQGGASRSWSRQGLFPLPEEDKPDLLVLNQKRSWQCYR